MFYENSYNKKKAINQVCVVNQTEWIICLFSNTNVDLCTHTHTRHIIDFYFYTVHTTRRPFPHTHNKTTMLCGNCFKDFTIYFQFTISHLLKILCVPMLDVSICSEHSSYSHKSFSLERQCDATELYIVLFLKENYTFLRI